MEQLSLDIESRTDIGKGFNRRLRSQGKLPGVLYGLGKHAPVTVDPRIITKYLLSETGRNAVLMLKGGGMDGKHALIKDYQVEPVSRKLVHVDLLEIDISKKIEVTVKLNFTGKSIGVAEGGVLNIVNRDIVVRCLPNAIPGHIDVDVTALKIADSIHLDQLMLPEGVEKVSQSNPTLATVVPPTKEEELAPSLAPSAEPEVITEKKAAEGEAAEGKEGDKKGAAAPAAEKKDEKKK